MGSPVSFPFKDELLRNDFSSELRHGDTEEAVISHCEKVWNMVTSHPHFYIGPGKKLYSQRVKPIFDYQPWRLLYNRVFIASLITQKKTCYIPFADLQIEDLWDSEKTKPSRFGMELCMLIESGYTCRTTENEIALRPPIENEKVTLSGLMKQIKKIQDPDQFMKRVLSSFQDS